MSGTPEQEPDVHQLLGAFVLGGLSPQEHHTFTTHLRGCETCQQEAAQLSGLPSLLALADPAAVPVGTLEMGAPEAEQPVPPTALLHAVRRRRLRTRWLLAAAAVVLVLGGVAGGVGLAPTLGGGPDVAQRLTATGTAGSSTSVQIDLVARGWGTQLDLQGRDLPTSGVLYLEVTDRHGRSWELASWSGVPSGRTTLSTACWMTPDAIRSLVIHTREGATVAQATT